MKYKINEIKDSWSLVSLLSNDSIENLNKLFGTHYTKESVKKQIKIKGKRKRFNFRRKPRLIGDNEKI